MKYILFLSHDASRTGAPILLLHFLRWMKANTNYLFLIVLRQNGVLRSEFEELGPVIIYSPAPTFKPTFLNKIKSRLAKGLAKEKNFHAQLAAYKVGLVFSNTLTNGMILQELSYLKVPVISYAHELNYTLAVEYAGPALDYTLRHTDFFLAGSEAVRQNLLNNYGLPQNKLQVVYSFVPPDVPLHPDAGRIHLRQSLGLNEDHFVIGGIGAGAWRKGIDLFLIMAAKLLNSCPSGNYRFVWIGVGAYPYEAGMLYHDVENAGLKSFVHLLPSTGDYKKFLAEFDVFVLPSREDPYPLVVLEAALMEKPLVCFKGAGGVPEFVRDDAGKSVPYLDIDAMANAIEDIRQYPEKTRKMTLLAKNRALNMHDVATTAPIIRNIIDKHIKLIDIS